MVSKIMDWSWTFSAWTCDTVNKASYTFQARSMPTKRYVNCDLDLLNLYLDNLYIMILMTLWSPHCFYLLWLSTYATALQALRGHLQDVFRILHWIIWRLKITHKLCLFINITQPRPLHLNTKTVCYTHCSVSVIVDHFPSGHENAPKLSSDLI